MPCKWTKKIPKYKQPIFPNQSMKGFSAKKRLATKVEYANEIITYYISHYAQKISDLEHAIRNTDKPDYKTDFSVVSHDSKLIKTLKQIDARSAAYTELNYAKLVNRRLNAILDYLLKYQFYRSERFCPSITNISFAIGDRIDQKIVDSGSLPIRDAWNTVWNLIETHGVKNIYGTVCIFYF